VWKKAPDDPDTQNVAGVIPVISVIRVILDADMGGVGEIPATYSDGAPGNRSDAATGVSQ